MRRSSIGLPRPSRSPSDIGSDVPFDDDDDNGIFDGGDADEPESPTRSPSKQQQTPRRVGLSNGVQDSEDVSMPEARSKGKAKTRDEDHDVEDVEEVNGRDLHDIEVQQDDDEEATPKKKPTEKRRRKRVLQNPRKRPFDMAQPSC